MKDWLTENWKKLGLGVGATLAVLLVGLYTYSVFSGVKQVNRTNLDGTTSELDGAVKRVASPLTGLEVTESVANLPVIGSMISNSSGARPQSGLEQAGVVFEAIAEGGITRYLALFQDQQPATLGPVRSLRPYYTEFSRAFNAYVAHVGGSPRALSEAKTKLGERDLDQFHYGTRAFDRVSFRSAPHNVYTSFDKLLGLTASNATSEFTPLLRKEPEPSQTPNATNITVNYSSSSYNTRWQYNQSTNKYLRFLSGAPHNDKETNKQLEFDVVVVLRTPYSIYTENGTSYNDIRTTGTGEALIFQDGTVTEASWSRSSETAQYIFTDEAGTQLGLNKGQVWFAVQPTSQKVSYE